MIMSLSCGKGQTAGRNSGDSKILQGFSCFSNCIFLMSAMCHICHLSEAAIYLKISSTIFIHSWPYDFSGNVFEDAINIFWKQNTQMWWSCQFSFSCDNKKWLSSNILIPQKYQPIEILLFCTANVCWDSKGAINRMPNVFLRHGIYSLN